MSEKAFQVIPHNPYRGSNPVVQEFDRRHGENSVVVNGFCIYPTGAKRDENPLGILCEPPENDPFELARLKVIYFKTLVERATDLFNETRHNFLSSAHSAEVSGHSPPDEAEMTKHLKSIQALVVARQKLHEEAFEELKATGTYKARKEQEIEMAKNREKAASVKASLQAFEL